MPFLVHVRFILEYIIPKIPEHDTFADNLFFLESHAIYTSLIFFFFSISKFLYRWRRRLLLSATFYHLGQIFASGCGGLLRRHGSPGRVRCQGKVKHQHTHVHTTSSHKEQVPLLECAAE